MEENTTYKPFAYLDNYIPAEGETVYYNTQKTLNKRKNDCAAGIGNSITLTAEANKFISNSSVNEANAQAEEWLNANSQAYANNLGTCFIDTIQPNSFVLSVNSITSNSFTLNWEEAHDNVGVVAYDIYIDDTFLASTSHDILTYTVTELYSSTAYKMYVIAKDAAGNSNNSNSLTITTLSTIVTLPVTRSVIFENRNTNWLACRDATAAITYYTNNNLLGTAKDGSEYVVNRYRAVIDTSSLTAKPKSAKLKFKFASNTVGNALTFHLFASNKLIPFNQNFQLADWDDWSNNTLIGSTTFPSNSTEYREIQLQPSHLDLLSLREGFNFFLISNGDKENNTPTSNSRPTLSMTSQTGEVYLECEF